MFSCNHLTLRTSNTIRTLLLPYPMLKKAFLPFLPVLIMLLALTACNSAGSTTNGSSSSSSSVATQQASSSQSSRAAALSSSRSSRAATASSSSSMQQAYAGPGCKIGGCSAQVCMGENDEFMVTTCEYREVYACYKTARCEVQASDNRCAWTPSGDLTACLASYN